MSNLPADRHMPDSPSAEIVSDEDIAEFAEAAIEETDNIFGICTVNSSAAPALDAPSHEKKLEKRHGVTDIDQAIAPPGVQQKARSSEKQTEKLPQLNMTGKAGGAVAKPLGEVAANAGRDVVEQRDPPQVAERAVEAAIVEAPSVEEAQTSSTEHAETVAPPTLTKPSAPMRVKGLFSLPRIIAVGLLILFLFSILGPIAVATSYGMNAYSTYNTLKMHANRGVQHLMNVKALLSGAKSNPMGALDARNLSRIDHELIAARGEFIEVQSLLDDTTFVHTVTSYLPQYRTQVTAAHTAAQIGVDITLVGQQIVAAAGVLVPKFRGPLLSDSHTPLVTASDIALVDRTFNNVMPLIADIEFQGSHLAINALPLNTHSKDQMRQYLQMLPEITSALNWMHGLLGATGWLLGVDQPRTFLIQTMDRSELRATGGFTGQYGELHIQNGRVAPFSLRDISFVEYSDNSPISGHVAPSAYRSWWPFANWGLRDSNLSADFPTSAQLAIKQYKLETKTSVDGVILVTPFLIENILNAIGPLHIPRYNETITAQNLEERLHYYQLDNRGIRKTEIIEHVSDPAQARKLFTSEVARTLMDEIRHAPPPELLALGLSLLHDMKTKDLQVYMTNPQVEDLLKQYGYAAEMDRSLTHDGLYIVQSNVSASKASQYVQTIVKDTVNLDAQGGAIHVMQLRLVYNQEGPVYGLDTYRDYVRVYVPPQAKFLWGDGFDTGKPLCGGPLAACSSNGIYSQQQLVCAPGQYVAGASAPTIGDPYTGQWHPLDKIGPPTNFKSDEPQRAMFAGYVVVPKNCTMTVSLSWYVPPLGAAPYTLLVQRQSSTYPDVDFTILPPPGQCASLRTAGAHMEGVLSGEDVALSLPVARIPRYGGQACYPVSKM
jgi:Protein of unknown function (DUF4012)